MWTILFLIVRFVDVLMFRVDMAVFRKYLLELRLYLVRFVCLVFECDDFVCVWWCNGGCRRRCEKINGDVIFIDNVRV